MGRKYLGGSGERLTVSLRQSYNLAMRCLPLTAGLDLYRGLHSPHSKPLWYIQTHAPAANVNA